MGDTSDVYSTREPQIAFNQRIEFCLDLHNHSVKAMRFPPKSYNKELESAEDRREREAQDLELAKEMAEEDDDAYVKHSHLNPNNFDIFVCYSHLNPNNL